ncbi:MAG: hypothetical protein IS632_08860 [Thaumarchaeota archaeon]|nr:hypothetical protein [Nitrososphaerota archaeon]
MSEEDQLGVAELASFISDAEELREMPHGTLRHTMPMGQGSMVGQRGDYLCRTLEWAAWRPSTPLGLGGTA